MQVLQIKSYFSPNSTTMHRLSFLFILLLLISCQATETTTENPIQEETFRKHLSTLAADDFQGRKPFTVGEEKTVNYLIEASKAIGLEPGNGDSYVQNVPLIEIEGKAAPTMEFAGPNPVSLSLGEEYVAFTQRATEQINVSGSDVVFCGYGIVAPEYNWNDYEGLDMKGKTAIVLVNDPGLGSEDSTFFKGNTMTYYGRWTYKYEEAARQGAAAIMIIHETYMAGYPFAVVRGTGGGKLNLENLGYDPCEMQGWISLDAAKKLFENAGVDLQKSMQDARKPGFKSFALPFKMSGSIENKIKRNTSQNVVAMIKGSERPDEYIIMTAHWDHLGVGAAVNGDSIYNGALDNATGTSALLTIAEAMKKQEAPKRSVVFLWVTAEEQGLLGSAYYAAYPIYPPEQTVANINMDGLNDFGLMKDFSIIGYGQSEMEDVAAKWAEKQGRYIAPDPEPEKGYFFRSDHFNFAKIGIPALYGEGNLESADGDKETIREKSEAYRRERYHLPSDNYLGESQNVQGMLQDAELFLNVATDLANSNEWPAWREGSEFKAARKR